MADVALLIHGGDRGHWLWEYYLHWFNKYWVDIERIEPIILYETKAPPATSLRKMATGVVPWGQGLIESLDKLEHKYIIYVHEDYFLTATPDFTLLYLIEKAMDRHSLNLVKMCGWWTGWDDPKNTHSKSNIVVNGEPLYLYNNNCDYLTSHQPSMWNRKFLRSTLQPQWTPWEHELKGSRKLKQRNIPIHAYRGEWPMPIAECATKDKPRKNTEKFFNILDKGEPK